MCIFKMSHSFGWAFLTFCQFLNLKKVFLIFFRTSAGIYLFEHLPPKQVKMTTPHQFSLLSTYKSHKKTSSCVDDTLKKQFVQLLEQLLIHFANQKREQDSWNCCWFEEYERVELIKVEKKRFKITNSISFFLLLE